MKTKNKISVLISTILGVIFFGALAVVSFYVPKIVEDMIAIPDRIGFRNEISKAGKTFIIADMYVMLAVAAVAVVLLFFLLNVVSKGQVFSKKTNSLLSMVSFCCFFEGILAFLTVFYFQLTVCVALAAWFLGFCLRIVKNVIEEATRIKEENDYTV